MRMPKVRWTAFVLSLAVLTLSIWGLIEMMRPTGWRDPLRERVDATVPYLGRVRVGESVAMHIVITNPHSTPQSLIGVGRY